MESVGSCRGTTSLKYPYRTNRVFSLLSLQSGENVTGWRCLFGQSALSGYYRTRLRDSGRTSETARQRRDWRDSETAGQRRDWGDCRPSCSCWSSCKHSNIVAGSRQPLYSRHVNPTNFYPHTKHQRNKGEIKTSSSKNKILSS